MGFKFQEKPGLFNLIFGKTGKRSPAEILLHELGHAQSYFNDARQHHLDSKNFDPAFTSTNMLPYEKREEYDVITKIENPAAHKLRPNSAFNRNNHKYGTLRIVKSPISTP